jgi:3-methyladenine DNA glycosylase AlkD
MRVSFSTDPDAVQITAELRAGGSATRAASEQNYLKSTLEFSGTAVPAIRGIVVAWRRAHPDLSDVRLTALAAALWDGPVFECKLAAIILLTDRRALLGPDDAPLVEQFLRTSGTWALVDSLAADVMGSLAERFPQLLPTLDRWATDDDFWIRRSALLALLVPLRRGDPTNFDRFGRYADTMLGEREFFIRKAIGWVLRETAKRQPEIVADWLAPRAGRASGVTMREAVKWLPAERRDALMAAYRARNAG